ncbi:uracil-DNA glycosylase [Temperatibacter marinus]|uniref:Uracil-DNA glycosylase n=1 Tax=Temperatibacter marinus TaxID=1456591 RepID=A0AA52EFD5_9PROT|nr:uracil-DNA glycosylase [Temperatibacter marinus]WND01825.1 uracil-DNA glycosylase [Temperatibacter marinus]
MQIASQLSPVWRTQLEETLKSAPLSELEKFLGQEKAAGKIIYPSEKDIFSAFNHTPFDEVKIVILGQDPYHGSGQAHGLCFSVPEAVKIPPSLRNIYKEIERDIGIKAPDHGNLTDWTNQGVLLLNSVLTVEHSKAASHQKKGWEGFTDAVIEILNEQGNSIVFMLWGAYAQRKASFVDKKKHLVLEAVHPSPLSAHKGFIGCGHFGLANDYLIENGKEPVNWALKPSVTSQSQGQLFL